MPLTTSGKLAAALVLLGSLGTALLVGGAILTFHPGFAHRAECIEPPAPDAGDAANATAGEGSAPDCILRPRGDGVFLLALGSGLLVGLMLLGLALLMLRAAR